jgi:hypothetical protein
VGEQREQTTLSCSLKSRQHSSVGKPVVILGNRKGFLARLTNRLGRRANAVPDDFVNRFAGRTEIKVIVRRGRHGTLPPNPFRRYRESNGTSTEGCPLCGQLLSVDASPLSFHHPGATRQSRRLSCLFFGGFAVSGLGGLAKGKLRAFCRGSRERHTTSKSPSCRRRKFQDAGGERLGLRHSSESVIAGYGARICSSICRGTRLDC